jgi:hypothetical protein
MSRNSLYAIIGLLAALVVGFGLYLMYQETQKPSLEIRLDEQGLSVDGNG